MYVTTMVQYGSCNHSDFSIGLQQLICCGVNDDARRSGSKLFKTRAAGIDGSHGLAEQTFVSFMMWYIDQSFGCDLLAGQGGRCI